MSTSNGLQGIVTVSYKTYRDTYHNTYQISRYVSLVEKVYRYTPKWLLNKRDCKGQIWLYYHLAFEIQYKMVMN